MKTVDDLSDAMRSRGMRVTPQRIEIARQLVGNTTHPTVDELFEAARADMPALSLKTVYQTVHDLEALGEVRLLDVGTGAVRVDPNVEHQHHHLVCAGCGSIRDLPVDFDGLRVPRRYLRGFTVDSVEVVFRGRCDDCLDR
jgi:Fur family transcriptional regulator, stress-responsive regulator